jgi:hypothetical protein
LPRFLQSLSVVLMGGTGLLLLIALIALCAFGAQDAVATSIQVGEPNPFRWT